jgi:hypothetical protein
MAKVGRLAMKIPIQSAVAAALCRCTPHLARGGKRSRKQIFPITGALLATASALIAQTARKPVYIPYKDAQPVLAAEAEILPPGLNGKTGDALEREWPNWIARRDREIRTRLVQGDEDSLINFLLFGTSYTRQPRIALKQLALLEPKGESSGTNPDRAELELRKLLAARADDLIRGVAAPHGNERLAFARRLLIEQKGFRLMSAAERAQIKAYLLSGLDRMVKEQELYAKILEEARLGSATEEFAERSRLFRTRGLSLDTSLLPNFAIEESLKALQTRQLLLPNSVRRMAVIGPGLDFTDKQEGYDFYPQQIIQPFAVIDTLLRLGLAERDALHVTTFDLSPRINDHLTGARARAQHGQGYVVQLPRDPGVAWKTEAINYWSCFGDRIGLPVAPAAVPLGTGDLKIRAVRIRPEIVSRITPVDLNIVMQRLELPEAERFDLIVATNILVYYDTFEQTLALSNLEHMLKPGGFLLSNNALLELPFGRMHSVGYLTVVYSDRPNDGDHIVWYRRAVD